MSTTDLGLPMQNRNTPNNPYPGLRPFEFADARYFFGRDEPTSELLSRLKKHRFLAVLGTSGSGKSSLVKAGLLQALNSGFMVKAGSSWKLAIMRPGGKPIAELAKNLQKKVFQPSLEDQTEADSEESIDPELALEMTEATLLEGSRGLIQAVQLGRLETGDNLLLVVDQFEELFRLKSGDSLDKIACDEADAFVKLLLAATKQEEVPIYIVITMRSEYLGQCSVFRELPEALNECQYLIPRLSQAQLRLAIEAPAKLEGARISIGLMNLLLKDLGDDPDQLPVLQHALMRTWDHWQKQCPRADELSIDDYKKIGGIDKALSQHADEIYDELKPHLQPIACRMFCCLTEKVTFGKEGNRRPTSVKEISAVAEATVDEVIEIADAFRGRGCTFLMPPAAEDLQPETVLDISHESLMRVWVQLKEWMEKEVQSAQTYRQLMDRYKLNKDSISTPKGEFIDEIPYIQSAEITWFEKWRNENHPNAAWARLYDRGEHPDTDFDAAIEYLDNSIRYQEDVKQQKKEAEEKALRIERERSQVAEERRREAEERRGEAEQKRRLQEKLMYGAWLSFFVILLLLVWSFYQLRQSKLAQAKAFYVSATASIDKDPLSSLLNGLAAMQTEGESMPLNRIIQSKENTPSGPELSKLANADTLVSAAIKNLQVETLRTDQGPVMTLIDWNGIVISGGADGTIRSWKDEGDQLVADKTIQGQSDKTGQQAVQSLAVWNGDLISGSIDGKILRWKFNKGGTIDGDTPIKTGQGPVKSLAVWNGGLISGGADGTIRRWKLAGKKIVGDKPINTGQGAVQSLTVWNGDLISGSEDGTIRRWKLAGKKIVGDNPINTGQFGVTRLVVLKNGDLISGGAYGTIRRWKLAGKKIVGDKPINTGQRKIFSLTVLKKGQLISGGADGTIRRWMVEDNEIVPKEPIQTGQETVFSLLSMNKEDAELYTGGKDGTIRRWRRNPLLLVDPTPNSTPGNLLSLVRLQKGIWISGGADGTIRRWKVDPDRDKYNAVGDKPINTGHQGPVQSLTLWNGDLISGGFDGTIRRWKVKGNQIVSDKTIQGKSDKTGQQAVQSLTVWNRDLISGNIGGTIRRWKVKGTEIVEEKPIQIAPKDSADKKNMSVLSLAVLNGNLISGAADGTIRGWKFNGKNFVGDKPIHTRQGPVQSLTVWNGALISGGEDGTINRWDDDLKPIEASPLGQGPVTGLIGLDTQLISIAENGTIHIWLNPHEAIQTICSDLRLVLPANNSPKDIKDIVSNMLNNLQRQPRQAEAEERTEILNKAADYCNRYFQPTLRE